MKKQHRFVGLLTAILVGLMIAVGVQAVSSPAPSSRQNEVGNGPQQTANAGFRLHEVTLVPITDPTATPFTLVRESPMPTPPAQDTVVVPTSAPLPPAPALAALADDDTLLFASDFNSADLDGWSYDQLFWDPQPAPAWEVKNDQYVRDVLVAPENYEAITKMNDTMAFPPITVSDYSTISIEVEAMASSGEKIGLVLGDVASQHYILMVVGTSHARGIGSSGLSLIKFYGEESRALLYQDPLVMIDNDTWHHLKLERNGDAIYAQVDDQTPVMIASPEDLTITNVGLLAGSDGYGFFDHLRVSGE
jgi:hypothetical protein